MILPGAHYRRTVIDLSMPTIVDTEIDRPAPLLQLGR